MTVRVGVDTGGTFTDLMASMPTGEIWVQKVPSTPEDDTRAFLEGLAGLAELGGFGADEVGTISHGTTRPPMPLTRCGTAEPSVRAPTITPSAVPRPTRNQRRWASASRR